MTKAKEKFFEESRVTSLIKAEIVSKYFWAWAKVMIGAIKKYPGQKEDKIAYVDLFAGPGRYQDGAASTPILVLQRAIEDAEIRDRLVAIFNDGNRAHARYLKGEILKIPNLDLLQYKPQVFNEVIGDKIVPIINLVRLVPTLSFIDPWGYKGLTLELVNSVVKDWGCDCLFFFNYNRISMGLTNPRVVEHMDALFGQERAESLRFRLRSMSAHHREMEIVNELTFALQGQGERYVLPFCFKDEKRERTAII